MERAVSQLREGEPINFERISGYAGTDLAYIVEIERARAKVGGSGEVSLIPLRMTTISVWKTDNGRFFTATQIRSRPCGPIESIVQA